MQRHPSLDEVLAEEFKDKEFRAIWEAGEPRRKVVSALLGERIKRKLTQEQLAHKAGLRQPSLARIENGRVNPSIAMLSKLAKALDMRLDIQFKPM
jgi:DNA-binding XRE family transcriptional regulator